MRPETVALLAALEQAFPTFRLTDDAQRFWDAALASYGAVQLAYAAQMLTRHHHHGAPNLPHVHQAICGSLRRSQKPVTGLWGETPLGPNGAPVLRWEDERVGLDGLPMPAALLRLLPEAVRHEGEVDAEEARALSRYAGEGPDADHG